ncbi:MAG: oxidoreductase [Euryarchaeota archaeon]|nr:oxidoreductase [Euryarchaeota archaeon]
MAQILVVGVGSMGFNHARVCSELGVLAGVCDKDEDAIERVSKKFNTAGFTDLKEAVNSLDIDGLIISTPTFTHLEVAKLAIENGIDVLVEKPIADSYENGKKMIEMAKNSDVKLSVGHIERFNPVIEGAKKLLNSDELGEIITISSRRVSNFPGRIRDVGVILDLGIHDIDNSISIMQSKPVSVYATGGSHNDIEFEDHVSIMIKFENNKSAVLEVNWITPMKVRTLSLTCEKGFMELDYMKQSITISESKFVEPDSRSQFPPKIEFGKREVHIEKQEPLFLEIKNFVQVIDNNDIPSVPGEDGLLALKVAEAAVQSLKTGEVIILD